MYSIFDLNDSLNFRRGAPAGKDTRQRTAKKKTALQEGAGLLAHLRGLLHTRDLLLDAVVSERTVRESRCRSRFSNFPS